MPSADPTSANLSCIRSARPRPRPRPRSRSPLGPLLIAFVVTASFVKAAPLIKGASPDLSAPTEISPTPTPISAADTPPAFPDTHHVPNGCFLSATAYLAKFSAAFPAEAARPVTIHCAEFHGPHTVALVSWKNRWWLRDEFFGVIALPSASADAPADGGLPARAQGAFTRHLARLSTRVRLRIVDTADRIFAAVAPARDVVTAAALLSGTSEVFRVVCRDREINLLFFRPAPDRIAVYDPLTGTATAECALPDHAKIVHLVAARLGYAVVSVHAISPLLVADASR